MIPSVYPEPIMDKRHPFVDPASVEAAKAECRKVRAEMGYDLDLNKPVLTVGPAEVLSMSLPAKVVPFSPAETQRKHIDEAFMSGATESARRFHLLQVLESDQAEHVARAIATRIFGEELESLPVEERVTVRFVAAGAVRALNQNWLRYARTVVRAGIVDAMKHECGREIAVAMAKMSPEKQLAVAEAIETRARVDRSGVLEGSRPIAPGVYLKIVDGEQR